MEHRWNGTFYGYGLTQINKPVTHEEEGQDTAQAESANSEQYETCPNCPALRNKIPKRSASWRIIVVWHGVILVQQGTGYESRINAVLRAYYEAHRPPR